MGIMEGSGLGAPLNRAGAPSDGTDEVQTLTLSAAPASGQWRLEFEGQITAALAHDISAADLQAALVGLATIGASGCTVGLVGQVYTVTFGGGNMQKRALPALSVPYCTIEDAGSADVTVAVAESTPGVTASYLGAPKGALLIDTTNAVVYVNTGTTAAPTWTKVGTQS